MTKQTKKPSDKEEAADKNKHTPDEAAAANALFKTAMADVEPIYSDKVELKKGGDLDPATAAHRRQAAVSTTDKEALSLELLTSESTPTYCAPGIQKRVLKQLQRDEHPWEASLDLHGFTLDQANRELVDFINLCRGKEILCLRIITGKGASALGKHPVLKSYTHHWLCNRAEVKALCTAQPKDGGAGAFIVLLKKQ